MSELALKFGGRLWTVNDPQTSVKIDGNVFGDGVLKALDEAKFAKFLDSVGGEANGLDLARNLLLQHAGNVMQQRTTQLGAMKAIDSRGFCEALVLSAKSAFDAHGAEVMIRELNVNLSPDSREALTLALTKIAADKLAANTAGAAPVSSPPAASPMPVASGKSPAAMIGGVGLLIVLAIGGYVVKTFLRGGGMKADSRATWDGTRAFRCRGHDEMAFGGVVSALPGQTAIVATEHCRLKLENVRLTAATGIEASGNAVVEVIGGTIEGTTLAAKSSGNARITFTGTTVKGQTNTVGNGAISGP